MRRNLETVQLINLQEKAGKISIFGKGKKYINLEEMAKDLFSDLAILVQCGTARPASAIWFLCCQAGSSYFVILGLNIY